jgi:hypothetical protein
MFLFLTLNDKRLPKKDTIKKRQPSPTFPFQERSTNSKNQKGIINNHSHFLYWS